PGICTLSLHDALPICRRIVCAYHALARPPPRAPRERLASYARGPGARTRRARPHGDAGDRVARAEADGCDQGRRRVPLAAATREDRKSTRLNSSHVEI